MSERGRRHRDACPDLRRASEEGDDAAVVPVERDEAARVEREAAHAAVRRRFLVALDFNNPSAHARSRFVSGPPVCASAWLTMRHGGCWPATRGCKGAGEEALEPASLREKVVGELKRALGKYEGGATG